MEKQELINLKSKIAELSEKEDNLRNLYLRKMANGELQGPPVGYPSLDKIWLKWYNEEQISFQVPKKKIYDVVYESNKEHLDEIALEYYGKNITYRELFANIDRLAAAFKANGVKKGEIVTVGMLTTPESLYVMLALNKIGAISSMIDPRSNVEGLHKYLTDNGSNIVIITDLFGGKFKKACEGTKTTKIISTSLLDSVKNWPLNSERLIKLYEKLNITKKVDNSFTTRYTDFVASGKDYHGTLESEYIEDSPALIVHSGGTTGFPKAVVMSDKAVLSSVYQGINSGIKFKRGETWLGIMPLFIIYGASTGTLLPLIRGITINLVPLFDPKKLPKLLIKKKPIHMTLAPSHFENLIYSKKLANEDLSYIVAPTVGGDSMDPKLEEKSNEWLRKHGCIYKVAKGYGSSETCSGVTVNVSNECNKVGSVGIPLPLTTVSVFNPDSEEELTYGEIGEVCVQGPTAMSEYLNSPEETKQVLKTHSDGKTWVHTGDLGYITKDGFIYITDRIKRMIINYGGFKILPSYVESILNNFPAIEKSVVIGVKDELHAQGEVPVACITLRDPSAKVSIEEIKKYCKQYIKDEHQIPIDFVIIDEIPYIPTNGKIDIKELKRIVNESQNKEQSEKKSYQKVMKKVLHK